MYCILGSQVNVRSTIVGESGSAQEVRNEFLVLFEDAIRQTDISKSVQRFQLAIEEAKVKLDLAVSPNTWLMPSRMVINTESVIGYNNELKRASHTMKLGVNPDINIVIKHVGIKHNLGRSKVKLLHETVVRKRASLPKIDEHKNVDSDPMGSLSTKHELNLAVVMLLAGVAGWYLFR